MFTARRALRGCAILDRTPHGQANFEARLSHLGVTRGAVAGSGKSLPGQARVRQPLNDKAVPKHDLL